MYVNRSFATGLTDDVRGWTDDAPEIIYRKAVDQESPLLMTIPSNASYITYTDADGQVYHR